MLEPAQKCKTNDLFMQKYTLKLFASKIAYFCCFSLDFLDFPKIVF